MYDLDQPRRLRFLVAVGAAAIVLAACAATPGASHTTTDPPTSARTPSSTTTTSEPATTTTLRALPPLSLSSLPVPTDLTCPPGLNFLAPANQAVGDCLPYAYLVGGEGSTPNGNTACPAGSVMSMGPVECTTDAGVVTAVPPGPDTCSSPGGPCPSSSLPLAAGATVLPWADVPYPTGGSCPSGDVVGETIGIATCVPSAYLSPGSADDPNHSIRCPAGSALRIDKLSGDLCTDVTAPHDIVGPLPATS